MPSASASPYIEAGAAFDSHPDTVLSRQGDDLLVTTGDDLAPASAERANTTPAAYPDIGHGSGYPAGLNVGDRLSNALAIDRHQPLPIDRHDFSHTDVAVVEV